jgi:hypothetical protein
LVRGDTRPVGTPDHVVTDSDLERLLEKLRADNQGRDVAWSPASQRRD